MMSRSKAAGFTLVEMAVVIVIVGMLLGGVMFGRSLIHDAQLQTIGDDATTYAVAIQQFRDKYGELPGDFAGATKIWGFAGTAAIPGCVSTAGITAVSATGTCDGNGDDKYYFGTADGYLAWQHLMLAGMIKGKYNGVGAPPVLGVNVPKASVDNAGWSLSYADSIQFADGGPNYWGLQSVGNVMFFGAASGFGDVTRGGIVSSADAGSVDQKYDDGLPGTGGILGEKPAGTTCYDTTVTPNQYALSNKTATCALRFMLATFKSERRY